jgi:hypothetical protein
VSSDFEAKLFSQANISKDDDVAPYPAKFSVNYCAAC